MKNWTIAQRLTGALTVLLAILLLLAGSSWLKIDQSSQAITHLVKAQIPALTLAGDIRYRVVLLRVTNFKHVVYDDAAKKDTLESEVRAQEQQLEACISKYQADFVQEEVRSLFSEIKPLFNTYINECVKLREASRAKRSGDTQAFLLSAGNAGNDLVKAVESLMEAGSQDANSDLERMRRAAVNAKRTIAAISLGDLLLGIAGGILITRSISKILKRAVTELSAGAEQTSAAAEQVAAASQTLAEGATEQAASLQETGAALEEISSMTKRNAENARETKELAVTARKAADHGTNNMQQMNEAMRSISASSDEIGKIIKTIDELAFQTNILALNAAVEAARAGEAGLGFAVVADEVRNLAQRSAQAAKETEAKIEAALANTARGVQVSADVGSSLAEIVQTVRKVDDLVGEIATASTEQSSGISQVNDGVVQMDKLTQSNASSAEESASAAQELSSQSHALRGIVSSLEKLVGHKTAENGTAGDPKQPRLSMAKRTIQKCGMPHPASTFTRGSDRAEAPAPELRAAAPREAVFMDF